MGWKSAHIGKEGDPFALSGVKVWHEQWRWLGSKTVMLPNPLEPGQTQSYMVCEIGNVRRPVRFAASKLASGLWSFYVPD
ncbi:hypothetical protein RZN05_11295 [Sphingomonas sp. HF-S4]|uniref:Uncharacterized protein n=1 Tax=Sphingomonas agrestis TaxID=3080540 RepID=A0ABU3Y845_9SPHN|nr:hypothetical protein [Sphingomonas sp. HF-S4]MDV3457570.1 hypothetical protein [Sphingomonas sp. HF-S4]